MGVPQQQQKYHPGTDIVTQINLSGDDESSNDNFETNQHNNSENNDFLNTNNDPSSSKGANETGNSRVNKRKRKSGNIIPKLTDIKRAYLGNYQLLKEIQFFRLRQEKM